ncbi:MAG: hypothetical protein LQ339_005605 [Xanthoria mediterranea]|nr:MAG: hypothetical protein LQ339_005605 [Xanthoria mediterranea]
MAPFFANQSCDPFLPRESSCELGNYINYAINVTDPSHVARGIAFATERNIRLVIRNTGHDYNGKSTGAGSLGIWTHHLKDIMFFDYRDDHYTGKAYKIGAGVQGIDLYEAGHKIGLTVISGECPTVGVAGGYTQGGGHSALASKYGLAAEDQVLAWEVITGTGEVLTATRANNTDLFWALSGGGGGTYSVVWSLTAKAHPDVPVSGANLSWTSDGLSQEKFFKSVAAYHAWTPTIVDAGAMSLGFGSNISFSVGPVTAPGVPAEDLRELLQPLLDQLDDLGINYTTPVVRQFSGYLEQFKAMMPDLNVATSQYGGWLLPRFVVLDNPDGLAKAYANITNGGAAGFTSVALNVNRSISGDVHNAVNPAWRTALLDVVISTNYNSTAPLSDMVELQEDMTDKFIPPLKALAPDSGVYLNEGDWHDPDWKQAFYGVNYNTLKSIKKKYDPKDIFYATTAVGNDEWVIEDPGRLCRVPA